jgi:phage shock protein A
MRLFDRITTLIKADAHGVIESIEDRRLLAKQLLRDAKLALDSKRARIAQLQGEQQRLALETKRLAAVMARVDQDVALAMQSGDDELSRSAIRKLLPLREADRRLHARMVVLREEESRSAERLAVQERDFEILKARVHAELAIPSSSAGDESCERPLITEDDVELELLRRRQSTDASASPQPTRGLE